MERLKSLLQSLPAATVAHPWTAHLLMAAVLAGGKSSRMGRDKASLPYRGGTLLEHQLEKLRALGIEDELMQSLKRCSGRTRGDRSGEDERTAHVA